MGPTLGGVYKIKVLIRDLLKEILQKIFGEEMGGVRGTQCSLLAAIDHCEPEVVQTISCTAGDGRNFASNFWKIFGTRFSQVFGIICISGGHQDLPPGFYHVFILIYLGMSRIQREKPARNQLE